MHSGGVAKGCRLGYKIVSYAFRMAARSSPSADTPLSPLARNILRHTLDCDMCQASIAAHERELELLATQIENANLRVNKNIIIVVINFWLSTFHRSSSCVKQNRVSDYSLLCRLSCIDRYTPGNVVCFLSTAYKRTGRGYGGKIPSQ